jgi:hypothetical protein
LLIGDAALPYWRDDRQLAGEAAAGSQVNSSRASVIQLAAGTIVKQARRGSDGCSSPAVARTAQIST